MTNNSKFAKAVFGLALGVFAITASTASAFDFTTNLKQGVSNPQVKELQKVLNMSADTQVAASGVGSAGNESSYFGALTKAAVIKFQNKYASEVLTPAGLTSGTGFVGAMTRAKLSAISAGVMTTPSTGGLPAGCTSTVGFSSTTGVKCDSTGTPSTQSGPITVALATSNPAAGTIVAGQALADLAHFTFSGSGTVNSVMLKRTGISDQNTLSNVYLYDGVVRLTDGYSFNTNGEITMNNIGLMVSGSKTISVKADVSSSASSGQTTMVTLTGVTAAGASASSVSLSGNSMMIASGSTLATAQFNAANTVLSASVNAGTSAYTVWSNSVQINTRSLWLKGANFRMVGSAPSDALANIKLYVDGVDTGKMATVVMTNGSNYAVFDLASAPKELTTGSHTIDVRADIVKGANRTVQFSIQQSADLMILDPQVGVNVAIGSTGAGSVPSNAGTISINTGSATAVIDPTFQSLTNVTGGASNTVIGKFKLFSYGEELKVNSLSVTPVLTSMTPAASGLDDVTLYFNGSQVGSQQDWTSGALTFQLGSQLIVPAGQYSSLEVRANIRTSAGTNYTAGSVRVQLNTGSSNAQGQSSYNTVNFPTANVLTSGLTVQTGTLAVSKNSGYANQSSTPNTTDVKIGSFTLQNQSSSEGLRVTSLSVAIATSGSLTNLSGLKTSETSGSGANPIQPQASNTFSVDFTLAPGATKTIDVFATTSTETDTNVVVTFGVTAIGTSSQVSTTVSGVTGQTITFTVGTVTNPPTLVVASSTYAQYIAAAGGATDGSKAVFNILSTGGSATISELKFNVTGTANSVTSVRVGSVSAPVVSGVAYLTGLNLSVPNGGQGLNQDVFISYSDVGINGVASSSTAILDLGYIKYTTGGTTKTLCTAGFGTCTAVLASAVTAPTMTLVGSKPTVAVVDSSEILSNGLVKLAEISVSANAKGDIKLSTLAIKVTSTGSVTIANAANNVTVKDEGNNTIATTNTGLSVAAGGNDSEAVNFTGDYLIPAGTTKTFKIYATAATVAVDDSLTTDASPSSTFMWKDTAGNSTTAVSGALIYNYPINTSSITTN